MPDATYEKLSNSKFTSDNLKAFILARKDDIPKSKFPKKNKLAIPFRTRKI